MKLQRVFTKLELENGQRIPRGYGLAYWDVVAARAVFYPIPINLLANVHRKIHQRIMWPSPSALDRMLETSYAHGLRSGSGKLLAEAEDVNKRLERIDDLLRKMKS